MDKDQAELLREIHTDATAICALAMLCSTNRRVSKDWADYIRHHSRRLEELTKKLTKG